MDTNQVCEEILTLLKSQTNIIDSAICNFIVKKLELY